MATHETTGAKWVRGLVKTIFVLCYVAFMWASIHHVATYFTDFEQNSGNTVGSYALAGAFDITALVTTIGVMFFRKSMPTWVLVIVWAFILAIAAYSFVINWEYASHYQNLDLIMQPTGATIPVYDLHGALHYVPVMQANTSLIWINPILASGFTIFSLVYSVIAEFFGTRLPTANELLARKQYLEETGSLLEEIKALEETHKKPSLIQRTTAMAREVKEAANELLSTPNDAADRLANEPDHHTDTTSDMDADPEAKEAENARNRNVLSEEEGVSSAARFRDHLGMIEGAMYDRLLADPSTLNELLQMASVMSISDLTRLLQRRFSAHAQVINETRVSQVFAAIQADYPDLILHANVDAMGPSTDPEQTIISEENGLQRPDDLSAVETANPNGNRGEIAAGLATRSDGNASDGADDREPDHDAYPGANEPQITESVGTNEDETDAEMPSNITPISRAKTPRITGKLEQETQPRQPALAPNMSQKKGAYALTKQAAADALGCPISEIERGLAEGVIKPFAKDPDKVLRSSLEGFVPRRRSRKRAKMSAAPK